MTKCAPKVSLRDRPVVLVVDDEQDIRDLIRLQLECDGYEVQTAGSVKQAWDRIQERFPDVVLTDLLMPEIPGEDLIESLHEENPNLPIIVMTGYPTLDSALSALQFRVHSYILKPFPDLRLLSNTVANALEKVELERENGLFRDQLEASYRKLLELETTRNGLSQLVVDDIARPLREVCVGLQALDKAIGGSASKQVRSLLAALAAEADDALRTAERLKGSTILQNGRTILDAKPCRLGEVIQDVASKILPQEGMENRSCRIEGGEQDTEILADRDLLEVILKSLLHVCMLRTPGGGEVVIRMAPTGDGRAFTCTLSDAGPPLDEGILSRIFDLSHADEWGIDLGNNIRLPFCRLGVEAMEGRIWAERNADGGLTMGLALRRVRPPAKSRSA